jgi:hypothetical protein
LFLELVTLAVHVGQLRFQRFAVQLDGAQRDRPRPMLIATLRPEKRVKGRMFPSGGAVMVSLYGYLSKHA